VRVAVSLHGTTAAVHDAAVGLPGSFGRATAGLRRLREHGVPFRVAGVATRANQHDILRLAEVARRAGAEATHVDVVREIGGAERDLLPDNPAALAQSWLTGPDFVADRAVFNHNRRWNACWAGKLTVTAAGDALPCVMGRSELVGNVGEKSLAAILAGPRLQALWGLTKDEVAVCRDCEYRYACGDCRPLALAEGDLHGPVSRCTYDPARGDWGRLTTTRRDPGPAPEGAAPRIALVPADRAVHNGLIVSTSAAANPSNAPRSAGSRSRNLLFGCDPDRALPDPPPVFIPLPTIESGNLSRLPLS
jgi:radical SAM protein with 4Fe4S-binding SPASM domain